MPVISEFMASNNSTLADGDNSFSDWIEIYNPSAAVINLGGWHLTDEATNLSKWTFPASTQSVLDPGENLVVFASGQETETYVDAGGSLHTNFKLAAEGEYLALTTPVSTIVQEFAPSFPAQRTDISYGSGVTEQDLLVNEGDLADILVPANASELNANWAAVGFVPDDNWFSGQAGIGYDTENSGTAVATYDATVGGPGVAPDPTTQGWNPDHSGGLPNQQVFDASPDLGFDAWAVIDQGGGGKLEYEFNLTNQQIAEGKTNGWLLSSTSRTLAGAYDVLVYRDGSRQYLVWKEIDPNGDLVVDLIGDARYTLTSDGTGSDAFHEHDLSYDPETGLATYWFDGTVIATWDGSGHSGRQLIWGAGSTGGQGEAHYHKVTHTVGGLGDFDSHIETNIEA